MIKILDLNMHGWPVISQQIIRSLNGLAELTKTHKPNVLCLQEAVPGRNLYYFNILKSLLPDYEIVLPLGFNEENYKSALSICLIQKSYELELLELSSVPFSNSDYDYSYLYNLILLKDVHDSNAQPTYILNLHMVSQWNSNKPLYYQMQRRLKGSCFWCDVLRKADELKDRRILAIGDFNAKWSTNGYYRLLASMLKDTIADEFKLYPTYISSTNGIKEVLDHALSSIPGKTYVDTTPLLKGYSDHAALISEIY